MISLGATVVDRIPGTNIFLLNVPLVPSSLTVRGVVVADLNSKVDVRHPALVGHLTTNYDFVTVNPSASAITNQVVVELHGSVFVQFHGSVVIEFHGRIRPWYLESIFKARGHKHRNAMRCL